MTRSRYILGIACLACPQPSRPFDRQATPHRSLKQRYQVTGVTPRAYAAVHRHGGFECRRINTVRGPLSCGVAAALALFW